MKGRQIRILLVEDNPGDVRLIQEMLKENGGTQFKLEHCDSLSDGLKKLQKENFDILLLDLGLPDSKGIDTLTKVGDQVKEIPVVVLTGLGNKEVGIKAVQEGAQDYLIKGQISRNLLVPVIRYAIERKRIEQALIAAKKRLEYVIASSPAVIYTRETSGNYRAKWISKNVSQQIGYSEEEFLSDSDFWINHVHPQDREQTLAGLKDVLKKDYYMHEYRFLHEDGTYRWMHDEVRVSRDDYGRPVELIGSWYDITERKRTEEHITESLREKETLLRELYHRTRNNMQVISNLIDLQAMYINDKKIVELFKETQNRIKSMALVHEKLYQSKDLSNVNLKDYINNLANTLLTSYQLGRDNIVLKLDIDSISVSIDAAIPNGLIVNELMSNSLKYAFPGDRQGEISIMLHKTEKGEIELYFSDNGIGFPKGFDINNPKSLGLKLVKNLTEKQLEGKVELRTSQRTEFLIKFKEPQRPKRI